MKIIFTFERQDIGVRGLDWFNFLSYLGHEVYFLNPTDNDKKIFEIYHTKINYVYDLSFIDRCNYWFYDITPKKWGDIPRIVDKLKSFGGELFCINFEDGYCFFEDLIDDYIKDKTRLFINNALFIDRNKYEKIIHNKLFLTTSYITNSQYVRWENFPVPVEERKRRIFFSGALTGFHSILTNCNKTECGLRYQLSKIIMDKGVEHIIRFTGYEPTLKYLYDAIPDKLKIAPINHGEYVKELTNSLVCLVVKGNSFPTNRFYESQAAGCVSFTNPLHAEVEFYGTGISGKDYIEINVDGSDLIDKFYFYVSNLEKAREISINGYENWKTYTKLDANNVWPSKTLHYHIDGVKSMTGIDLCTL